MPTWMLKGNGMSNLVNRLNEEILRLREEVAELQKKQNDNVIRIQELEALLGEQ